MTIDATVLGAAVTALGLIAGAIWALMKHIEGKFETARQTAELAVAEARKDVDADIAALDRKLDDLRSECARRDDLHEIKDTLTNITKRIDGIHSMLARRGETA